MNIQESEEFKTTKFFCKTDFDMGEIKKEEAAYVPLPRFYTFKSREERERILYKNFVQVGQDVKEMIKDVLNKRGAKCSGNSLWEGKAWDRNGNCTTVHIQAATAGEGNQMHEIL